MQHRIASEWQRVMLGLAVCIPVSIWGLVALFATLQGTYAQDAQPAEDEAAAEAATEADDTAESQSALPSGVYRVAFVDMEKVIRSYPRWWKSSELIEEERRHRIGQLEEEERELERMGRQLEEARSNPSDELVREYTQRVYLLRANGESFKGEYARMYGDLTRQVYNDAYEEIEALAEDRFDVVLGVAEREIRTGTQAEFFQKIPARGVVIYPPENDLTRHAIAKMEVKALFDPELLAHIQTTAQQLLADINSERQQAERPTLEQELEALGMTEELERVRALG